MQRYTRFVGRCFGVAQREAVDFAKHVHVVALLLLATVGLTAILSELPFLVTLPMWIESEALMAFLASTVVLGLALVPELVRKCVRR